MSATGPLAPSHGSSHVEQHSSRHQKLSLSIIPWNIQANGGSNISFQLFIQDAPCFAADDPVEQARYERCRDAMVSSIDHIIRRGAIVQHARFLKANDRLREANDEGASEFNISQSEAECIMRTVWDQDTQDRISKARREVCKDSKLFGLHCDYTISNSDPFSGGPTPPVLTSGTSNLYGKPVQGSVDTKTRWKSRCRVPFESSGEQWEAVPGSTAPLRTTWRNSHVFLDSYKVGTNCNVCR